MPRPKAKSKTSNYQKRQEKRLDKYADLGIALFFLTLVALLVSVYGPETIYEGFMSYFVTTEEEEEEPQLETESESL
eukprot:CAMPEP_0197854262 /NCGR_PEP_ID=MMETSP1438-20131217/24343_1 /TAXON_ID=1461541 /ORGANISM="Pterosperma sp., Strain CCMP1384" /LENGTH=76 /DNA_ID=CAMNT_0043468935 /DNA_START=72 /DNA_END=302 /DNA_ORIENTATION=+